MPEFKSILTPKKPDSKTSVIIGGKMYSGKSYMGAMIRAYSKNEYGTSPIADPIKELVNAYFGLTKEEALALKAELRPDYQHVGTEVMRHHYKNDIWIVLALRHPMEYLIFDDVRHQFELDTIKEFSTKSLAIWVETNTETRRKRCDAKFGAGAYDKQDHSHSSEQGFTGKEPCWDIVISNDSDNEKRAFDLLMSIIDEYKL